MADSKADLIAAAKAALDKAYAPYSDHPVGAAVLADDGTIHVGCNVENAAYPLGSCAEATAIANMVLSGQQQLRHVVIVGPGDHLCTPCGGCRQKIREFAGSFEVPVTICSSEGAILLETDSATLLPHSFGPENIDKIRSE